MMENNDKANKNKLEFNTFCIFTKDGLEIEEIIGLIFKDYIENLEINSN